MERVQRVTTLRQLELMLEFLEGHGNLALGRIRNKEARADSARMWIECAEILNTEGPTRTAKEWSKVWSDFKCKVRAKLVSINANQHATGGGPSSAPILTRLEEKVANIIGRDFGPLSNIRQDQFAANYDDGVMVEVIDEQPENLAASETATYSLVFNVNEAELHTEHVRAISPVHVRLLPASPAPSLTRQAPSLQTTSNRTRKQARTVRKWQKTIRSSNRPIPQITTQSGRSALEKSRLMMLEIEKIYAEAAYKTAQAVCTIADAFKQISESIDRYGQKRTL